MLELEKDSNKLLNYAGKLEAFSRSLISFTDTSERKFLEIGGKLNDYLHSADSLIESSRKIASSISDESLQKGIDELTWLLKEFNSSLTSSLKQIQSDKKELTSIQPHIESIINTLDGFSKIVKQLRMLGIATKIESARLGTEDQGFNALADNVDKLSNQISDKVNNIANRSNFLFAELNNTIQLLGKLEKEQGLESESILENINKALLTFSSKHLERINTSNKISKHSLEIKKSINDIVVSLQFHDITRQQLDHIRHTLEEITTQIKHYSQTSEVDLRKELGSIFDICQLQSIQLRSSLEEFTSAVNQIVVDLNTLKDAVIEILNSVNELIVEPAEDNKCCLSVVKYEIDEIQKGFERNNEIGTQLAKSINSVVAVVEDLSKYVLEIEDVGSEIEIIALNARVKAARTGSNGSALGVLSERIQKLSIDAKEQTGSTSNILSIVNNTSFELRTNVQNRSYNDKNHVIREGINKIESHVNSMIEKEQDAAKQIENLRDKIQSLITHIELTIDGIDVQNDAKEAITNVVFGLEELLSNLSKQNILSNKSSNTSKLLSKYTMKSERINHQSYADGWRKNAPVIEMKTNSETTFGENVELF